MDVKKNMQAELSRCEALRREFEAEGESPEVPLTLCTDIPAIPYGETVGGAERLARRIAGRLLRWYLTPILTQQNRINRALLAEIETLRAALAEKTKP